MGTESGFAALADGDPLPVAAPAPAAPSGARAAAPAVEDDTESRSRASSLPNGSPSCSASRSSASSSPWSLLKAHESLDATERDRLRVQARVVDDNVGQQLEGMYHALASVGDDFLATPVLRRLDPALDAHEVAERRDSRRPLDGSARRRRHRVASSVDALLGRDFADREYFGPRAPV